MSHPTPTSHNMHVHNELSADTILKHELVLHHGISDVKKIETLFFAELSKYRVANGAS